MRRLLNKYSLLLIFTLLNCLPRVAVAAGPFFKIVNVSHPQITVEITWTPGSEPGGRACHYGLPHGECSLMLSCIYSCGNDSKDLGSMGQAGSTSWATAQSFFGSSPRTFTFVTTQPPGGTASICFYVRPWIEGGMWGRSPDACGNLIVRPPQSCTISAQPVSFGTVELADLNGRSMPVQPRVTCTANGTVNIILRNASSNSSTIDFGSGLTGTLTHSGAPGNVSRPINVTANVPTAVNGLVTLNSPAYVKTGNYSASAVAIVDWP